MPALFSPLAIAPMIDWTNTHFRVLMRLLAPKALLYTEMLTAQAVLNNPRVLKYHPSENPLALQLGGSDPALLVQAAKIGQDLGFQEINLNLGCPSNKVQAGQFGACLMANPQLVAECISALKQALSIAVTAKTRIGIDYQDSYDFFADFIQQLIAAGCDKIIIHARKAWLKGLNPKQNRTIPAINYDFVYNIKQQYPAMPMVINGDIKSLAAINDHLSKVDGVMVGRLACSDPYQIALIHQDLFPALPILSREAIIEHYFQYMREQFNQGTPLSILLKPIFNIKNGLPHAKLWRQDLLKLQQSSSKTRSLT